MLLVSNCVMLPVHCSIFFSPLSAPFIILSVHLCVAEPVVYRKFSLSVSTFILLVDLFAVIKYLLLCFPWRQKHALCFQSCSTLFSIFFLPEKPHHFLLFSCKLIAMLQIVCITCLQESFWNRLQRIEHLNNETFGQINLLNTATAIASWSWVLYIRL